MAGKRGGSLFARRRIGEVTSRAEARADEGSAQREDPRSVQDNKEDRAAEGRCGCCPPTDGSSPPEGWDLFAMCSEDYTPRLGALKRLWLGSSSGDQQNEGTRSAASRNVSERESKDSLPSDSEARRGSAGRGLKECVIQALQKEGRRLLPGNCERVANLHSLKDEAGGADMPLVCAPQPTPPAGCWRAGKFVLFPKSSELPFFLSPKTPLPEASPLLPAAAHLQSMLRSANLSSQKENKVEGEGAAKVPPSTRPSEAPLGFEKQKLATGADAPANELRAVNHPIGSPKAFPAKLVFFPATKNLSSLLTGGEPREAAEVKEETRSAKRRRFSIDAKTLQEISCSDGPLLRTSFSPKPKPAQEATAAASATECIRQEIPQVSEGEPADGQVEKPPFFVAAASQTLASQQREEAVVEAAAFRAHRKRKRFEAETRLFLLQQPAVATNAAAGKALLEVLGTALTAEETLELRKREVEKEQERRARAAAAKAEEEAFRRRNDEGEEKTTKTFPAAFAPSRAKQSAQTPQQVLLPNSCPPKRAVCTLQFPSTAPGVKAPLETFAVSAPTSPAPSSEANLNKSSSKIEPAPLRFSQQLRILRAEVSPGSAPEKSSAFSGAEKATPTGSSLTALGVGAGCGAKGALATFSLSANCFLMGSSQVENAALPGKATAMAAFGSAEIEQPPPGQNPFGFQSGRGRRRRR